MEKEPERELEQEMNQELEHELFARSAVTHESSTRASCLPHRHTVARRLPKRRREVEQELEIGTRRGQIRKGLIRNHSVFLKGRKAELCFTGCSFVDSLQADHTDLTREEVLKLAAQLMEDGYISPVMKYVDTFSYTTLHYRYSKDERIVATRVEKERLRAASAVEYVILMSASNGRLKGRRILELVGETESGCENTLRNRLKERCQEMLHHGYLIPEDLTRNPEGLQIFRENACYWPCADEESKERARDADCRARNKERMGSEKRRRERLHRFSLIRSISLNRDEPTKIPTPLRRAESLRAERNRRKYSLYWTMNLENTKEEVQGNLPVQRELKKRVSSRRKIEVAADVEVVSTTVYLHTYNPPDRKISVADTLRAVYKKLQGIVHNKGTTAQFSISSIDAEWSVY